MLAVVLVVMMMVVVVVGVLGTASSGLDALPDTVVGYPLVWPHVLPRRPSMLSMPAPVSPGSPSGVVHTAQGCQRTAGSRAEPL